MRADLHHRVAGPYHPGHPPLAGPADRARVYAVFKKTVVNPTVAKVIEIAQAVCDFDAQEQQGSQWAAMVPAATPRTPVTGKAKAALALGPGTGARERTRTGRERRGLWQPGR